MLAVLLGALLYYPASKGGFVFDDYHEIADRPAIRAGFFEAVRGNPFRAIPTITYRVDYLIGGGSPRVYHLTNIFLHILAAIVLAALWRRAVLWAGLCDEGLAWWMGAMCGLSFLFHPLNVESAAYISSRADVLASLFLFLGLLGVFSSFEGSHKPFWSVGSVLMFCAALFCKESSVAGLALAGVLVFLMRRGRGGSQAAPAIYGISLIILLALWLYFRLSFRIDLGTGPAALGENILISRLWAVGTYTRLALLPVGLRIDYGQAFGGFADLWGHLAVGAAVIALSAAAPIRISRSVSHDSRTIFYVAILWWAIAIAMIVAPPLADPVAEHRAYFAMGAFSAMPAIILLHFSKSHRTMAIIVAAVMIFSWIASASAYVPVWCSAASSWANAVRRQPSNARAWDGLGSTLLDGGNTRLAKRALEIAIALDPTLAKPEGDLGLIAMERGDFEAAASHFRTALMKNPDEWRTLINFGALEEKRGNLTAAEEYLRRAILINSKHPAAWFGLGNVFFAMKRYGEAENSYQEALARDPDHLAARTNLAQVYENMGNLDTAMAELGKVIIKNPAYVTALLAASRIEYEKGDMAASVEYLKRYLALRPDDQEARSNLADMLKRLNRE